MPWKQVVPESRASPLLTPHMKTLLKRLPRECFIAPGGRRLKPGDEFWFERKGFLDLYSGESAVAKEMAKRLGVWVVTVDFAHGENQDLLDRDLQQLFFELAEADVFLGLGAAPECCSFSRAVCPAVRSSSSPEGLPHLTKNMKVKVDRGNRHAAFLLRLVLIFIKKDLPYWIENPDGSFLWLLKDWLDENGARRINGGLMFAKNSIFTQNLFQDTFDAHWAGYKFLKNARIGTASLRCTSNEQICLNDAGR